MFLVPASISGAAAAASRSQPTFSRNATPTRPGRRSNGVQTISPESPSRSSHSRA